MARVTVAAGKGKAKPAREVRPEVAIEFDSSRGFVVKTPGHTIQCAYMVRTMAFVGTFFQVEVKGVVPADRRRKLKAAGAIAAPDLARAIVKALKSHGCKEKIEIFTHNKEIRLR
jgi:glyoxylase-like metal-dependent hydrolase (beta-lactamase superfamily II)